MKDFSVKGQWYLPSNPEDKVWGELTFSQADRTKLALSGLFDGVEDFGPPLPLILGWGEDGKSYTLNQCVLTSVNHMIPAGSQCSYHVSYVFEGIRAAEQSELQFRKMMLDLTYLYDWVNITGIGQEVRQAEFAVNVSYKAPEDIDAQLGDKKISIAFSLNSKLGPPNPHLNEKVSFFVEFPEDKAFSDLLDIAYYLQNFLDLGTGKENSLEGIRFLITDERYAIVNCSYQQVFYSERKDDRMITDRMVFSLEHLGDQLEEALTRWMNLCAEMKPVIQLFFRERHAKTLHLELRLLTLAQALEKYHSHRFPSQMMAKEIHSSVKKRIKKAVPRSHRGWVMDSLQYSNQKSLRRRMSDLVAERHDLLLPLVGNLENLVAGSTNSRNYYTHFGENMSPKALKGHALLFLVETLSILLESCFLAEIGIDIAHHPNFFHRTDRYTLIRHNSTTLSEALGAAVKN